MTKSVSIPITVVDKKVGGFLHPYLSEDEGMTIHLKISGKCLYNDPPVIILR